MHISIFRRPYGFRVFFFGAGSPHSIFVHNLVTGMRRILAHADGYADVALRGKAREGFVITLIREAYARCLQRG